MESNVATLHLYERLWAWFEDNRKMVVWGASAVGIISVGVGFFIWRGNARQASANEALSSVLNQATSGANRDATTAEILRVSSRYPQTAAGARALLLAAGDLFSEGKAKEARPIFERFLREYHESPLLGQALLGVAACLETEGSTNEAIAAYLDIVQHHSSDNVVPQARYALGRLYEAQGKFEQARDQLDELARNPIYNTISADVNLRLASLFERHPELAPARRAVSTNMPPITLTKP